MTLKQKRFVENILAGENGTNAVKKAGYGRKNKIITDKTAQVIASENLSKPIIKAEINKRMAKIEEKTGITIKYIQDEHLRLMALCEENRDRTNLTTNLVSLGKTIGAYQDNIKTDNTTRQELNSLQQKELEDIARETKIRLSQKTG